MLRGPQLSSDIRGQIIGMSRSNKSAREIGRELGISHTTVAYHDQKTQENRLECRHAEVWTSDSSHRTWQKSLGKVKEGQLFQIPSRNYQSRTCQRFDRYGAEGSEGARCGPLCGGKETEDHTPKRSKRKNWCRDIAEWSDEEWRKVIWSDESSVELGLSSRKVMVWRSQGQRYQADCLAPNRRSGRISVMFWSCFWQDELGPLVALPKGSVNSARYCEILEEHLFPFYSTVKAVIERSPGSWKTMRGFTN